MMQKQLLTLALLVGLSAPLLAQKLISSTKIGSLNTGVLSLIVGPLARYDIDLYRVLYTTKDIEGKLDTASGLIALPLVTNASMPLLVYQHGTVTEPSDVPSNLRGGWQLAAATATIGYFTLAPDYLGLGESRGFHPYVHADSEASAAIDLMFASREFVQQNRLNVNKQIFLTGYSQGGHASMALHRALEANYRTEFPVTAAAHLSGPYSISGETFKRLISEEPYFYQAYLPFTVLSYQTVYKLYNKTEEYFKAPYAAAVDRFFRREINLDTLNNFLIRELTARTGAAVGRRMFQDTLIRALETNPDHPLRRAMRANDTYDWAPQAPTRIFYCQADDQVTFRNSILADSVMQRRGARNLQTQDVNPTANHTACVQPAALATVAFFSQYFSQSTRVKEATLQGLNLYPNPGAELIRLEGLPAAGRLLVWNSQGQIVWQTGLQGTFAEWSVANWPNGIYAVRVESPQGAWHERLIVAH